MFCEFWGRPPRFYMWSRIPSIISGHWLVSPQIFEVKPKDKKERTKKERNKERKRKKERKKKERKNERKKKKEKQRMKE